MNSSQKYSILMGRGFWYCLLIYLWVNFPLYSQNQQPLSRNDKALITQAEDSYEKFLAEENWNEASRYINQIANIYWEHHIYEKAIEYFKKSLDLNFKIGNENGIAMLHNNLGMLSADIEDYESAIDYFQKTLAARKAFKNKEGIIAALKNLSVAQNNLGQYDKSIRDLQEALDYAREDYDLDQITSCYLLLSETYEKAGDIPNTMHYYDLYRTITEMQKNRELVKMKQLADEETLLKQMAELEAKRNESELNALRARYADTEKKLAEFDQETVRLLDQLDKTEIQIKYLETEKENEKLRAEEKLREEKALRNLFLLGALSLLLLSFFIFRNYRSEKRSKKALATKNEKIQHQNEELEALNAIIAKHNKRMKRELDVGREIQMSMLPENFPETPSLDISASLLPAREVGGDLYDVFQIDEDHLMFGVGDVSDKGVPAALVMAVTKTLIKTNAHYSTQPGKIITQVNAQFSEENRSSMFISFFLGIIHKKTGLLHYCNAGHNPPLLVKSEGQVELLAETHGPVLGALDEFEYSQGQVYLKDGDRLILYTDGVTEAFNENQELYSEERLVNVFKENGRYDSTDTVNYILEDLQKFRGNTEQSDDITILTIRKTA